MPDPEPQQVEERLTEMLQAVDRADAGGVGIITLTRRGILEAAGIPALLHERDDLAGRVEGTAAIIETIRDSERMPTADEWEAIWAALNPKDQPRPCNRCGGTGREPDHGDGPPPGWASGRSWAPCSRCGGSGKEKTQEYVRARG